MEYKYCPYCRGKLIKAGKNVLKCPECHERFYKNPVPAVAVVISNNGKILLVKRREEPKKGMWSLPGGFMEINESVEEAAMREILEETSLKISKFSLLDIATEKSKRYTTVLIVGFFCEEFSGDLKPGDDSEDAKFFKFKELPEIAFSSHRRFINKYLKLKGWEL